jgi:hypothetical protein
LTDINCASRPLLPIMKVHPLVIHAEPWPVILQHAPAPPGPQGRPARRKSGRAGPRRRCAHAPGRRRRCAGVAAPGGAGNDRVDRATARSETVAAMALADVLAHHAQGTDGPPGQWLDQLRALVDGASPDEVKSLRRVLFERPQPRSPASTPTWNWRPAGATAATPTAT